MDRYSANIVLEGKSQDHTERRSLSFDACACLNFGEASCPVVLKDRSFCPDRDIGEILSRHLPERR